MFHISKPLPALHKKVKGHPVLSDPPKLCPIMCSPHPDCFWK